MVIRLIVFDLDGTLIDSSEDLADAVNELRGRYGLDALTERTVGTHVGRGVSHLLRNTIPSGIRTAHPKFQSEYVRIYQHRCTRRTRLMPGAAATLKSLSQASLAVVSNKPGHLSRRILRKLGILGMLRAVVGGDEVRRRKPHPASVRMLLKKFGVKPHETLVVGDSRFDMEAGTRAGCHLCGCTFGFGTRGELSRWRPGHLITRLSQLTRVVKELNAQ